MATTTFRSFAELAAALELPSAKSKGNVKVSVSTFETVKGQCGRKAALVWAFLQEQEYRARYGLEGQILHTLEDLQGASGYDAGVVVAACVLLVRKGWARFTTDGKHVRAS